MNKLAVIGIFGVLFLFAGCTKTETPAPEVVVKKQVPVNYSGTFTSVGVGPHISKDNNVGENTLVLKGWSKDVMIHLYVPQEVYSEFFSSETGYLPGNKIDIAGSVVELPGTLGNRYFEVKAAQSMNLVSYPDIDEINDILISYGSCQQDSDCEIIGGMCPLDCYIGINRGFKYAALEILGNYVDIHGDGSCSNSCPYTNDVACRFNTCMVSYWSDYEIPYQNGPIEERFALACPDDPSNCNPDGGVVCGSDGKNYENYCVACTAGVGTYVIGECIK